MLLSPFSTECQWRHLPRLVLTLQGEGDLICSGYSGRRGLGNANGEGFSANLHLLHSDSYGWIFCYFTLKANRSCKAKSGSFKRLYCLLSKEYTARLWIGLWLLWQSLSVPHPMSFASLKDCSCPSEDIGDIFWPWGVGVVGATVGQAWSVRELIHWSKPRHWGINV